MNNRPVGNKHMNPGIPSQPMGNGINNGGMSNEDRLARANQSIGNQFTNRPNPNFNAGGARNMGNPQSFSTQPIPAGNHNTNPGIPSQPIHYPFRPVGTNKVKEDKGFETCNMGDIKKKVITCMSRGIGFGIGFGVVFAVVQKFISK